MPGQQLRLVKDANGDGGMSDPFALSGEGYSPDKFYTRSTDGKGASETKYFKAVPSIMGSVGELVASRQIPQYKTEADFIRDAIYHRLKYVAEGLKDGRLEATINRALMLSRIQDIHQELSDMNTIVTQYEEVMSNCVQTQDWVTLEGSLDAAESDLATLKPAYAERLQRVIERYRAEAKGKK